MEAIEQNGLVDYGIELGARLACGMLVVIVSIQAAVCFLTSVHIVLEIYEVDIGRISITKTKLLCLLWGGIVFLWGLFLIGVTPKTLLVVWIGILMSLLELGRSVKWEVSSDDETGKARN